MLKNLLNERFACKKFITGHKISIEDLMDILDSARLSPSSYGLQAWKFIVVLSNELKSELSEACYNQPQIDSSSALVFLCARNDLIGENSVLDSYAKLYEHIMQTDEEKSYFFKNMINEDIGSRSAEQINCWVQKQVYLASMTLMLAATEKGIDSCPMEGFDPSKVSNILNLEKNLIPTVLVALGKSAMEKPKKVRFDLDTVIQFFK